MPPPELNKREANHIMRILGIPHELKNCRRWYQTFVFKGPSNQEEKGEQFLNQSGEEGLPAP